jgi:hypothetical protein
VITHSIAPKTRKSCVKRTAQARLNKSVNGIIQQMAAIRIDPERRKCAPNSTALKKIGIKRTIIIVLHLSGLTPGIIGR